VAQCQFSDPDFISGTHHRENLQFVDNVGIAIQIKFKEDLKI
jgi:hypothetical protein